MDMEFHGNKTDAIQFTMHNIIILTGPMTVDEYKNAAKNLLSRPQEEILAIMTASVVALEKNGFPLYNPQVVYTSYNAPACINN